MISHVVTWWLRHRAHDFYNTLRYIDIGKVAFFIGVEFEIKV